MREAADLIRTEVGHMMNDVELLGERVRKLQTHFGQANEDIGNILISAEKIEKRGGRIEELEFEATSRRPATPSPAGAQASGGRVIGSQCSA